MFTFTKLLDRSSVTYQAQQSADLVTWQDVPDEVITTGPDTETRRVAVGYDPAVPRLFFRLRITAGP